MTPDIEKNEMSVEASLSWNILQIWTAFFLIAFGTYHWMIDGRVGFGYFKLSLMIGMVVGLFLQRNFITKAFILGIVCLSWQWFVAFLHPETLRYSTLLFSVGLCMMYVSFYNLIYVKKVFTIQHFSSILNWMMLAYFYFCVIQQACLLVGISQLPLINHYYLGRGIGVYSLSMEPSTFARFMLICYYCYLKIKEWERGEGKFTPKELVEGDMKWVTIRFLWMMTTMGSGTAYVCLVLLSLYFISRKNAIYFVPMLIIIYMVASHFEIEQFNRASSVINAIVLRSDAAIEAADGSGMCRAQTMLNMFDVDYSDAATWFGHGCDYARNNNLVLTHKATPFDDYGLILSILYCIYSFLCAYKITDLSAFFMIAGVGGGLGHNIHYAWELAMIMTCYRYFSDCHSQDSNCFVKTKILLPNRNFIPKI